MNHCNLSFKAALLSSQIAWHRSEHCTYNTIHYASKAKSQFKLVAFYEENEEEKCMDENDKKRK